jgi:sterol desaturase/sphingolipid hydroxylase (fatty acid hydroxylase superfamily)
MTDATDSFKNYVRNTRGRMFQSDFLEFFSKVHPSMPFIFWIPVTLGIMGYALSHELTSVVKTAAMVPVGFLTWQFMEYFIHGYLFHWLPGPTGHGFHHKYPDDDTRLVMPLPVSITLASLIGGALWLVGRPDVMIPYWAGIVVGYLWYDLLHWATHHVDFKSEWGKKLRAHHMAHHFADYNKNYGISHMWMDRLLGTLLKRETK